MIKGQAKFFRFNDNAPGNGCLVMQVYTNQDIDLNEITCKQILTRKVKNIKIKTIKRSKQEPEYIENVLMDFNHFKNVWGSVAIQQGLRKLGLIYKEIGRMMGVAERTVWNNCNGKIGVYSWGDRENQENILSIATLVNLTWGKK